MLLLEKGEPHENDSPLYSFSMRYRNSDGFYLREPTTCSEQGLGKKEQLCTTIREGLDLLTGWLREYL